MLMGMTDCPETSYSYISALGYPYLASGCTYDLQVIRAFPMRKWALKPWGWMSLPTKVSLVILLIVGLSALSGEFLDRGVRCPN